MKWQTVQDSHCGEEMGEPSNAGARAFGRALDYQPVPGKARTRHSRQP